MDGERVWRLLDRAREEARAVDLGWLSPDALDNDWTLAPDTLRLLMAAVTAFRPRHVLEMGTGVSTQALARACGTLPGRRAITSLDHDPDFGPAAARALAGLETAPNVRVKCQLAPVVARGYGGRVVPVYRWERSRFASRRPLDLVVIDGPPLVLGGRAGTLYQVMDVVGPGAVVLLDDARRPAEQAAMAEWRSALGPAIDIRYFDEYVKGLAVIVVRTPVTSDALWRHQQELCAAELERLIPEGARYLQPGFDDWDLPMLAGRQHLSDLSYAPSGDAQALAELDAAAPSADFLVLLWPSFWWIACYPNLFATLDRTYACPIRNACMRVYDLRPRT